MPLNHVPSPSLPGLDNADADEADAQALATLLQLEAVLIHSGTSGYSHEDGPPAPINYVCRVTDPRTRDVIVGITAAAREGAGAAGRRLVTVEPINPDELLAGVLTQVGGKGHGAFASVREVAAEPRWPTSLFLVCKTHRRRACEPVRTPLPVPSCPASCKTSPHVRPGGGRASCISGSCAFLCS